jgi:hypothetical protein
MLAQQKMSPRTRDSRKQNQKPNQMIPIDLGEHSLNMSRQPNACCSQCVSQESMQRIAFEADDGLACINY